MVISAIYTAIIGFVMLFIVMGLLVFSVKWMYVLNLLEKAKKSRTIQGKMDNSGK